MKHGEADSEPAVWVITLGWNHAEDTLECLASLRASRGVRLRLLYVDNGSREEELERVRAGAPDVEILRHERNVGVPRGFNAGFARALRGGAEFLFMANNDTVMDPDCIARLAEAARRDPEAGVWVPKIYYHEAPRTLWSAGSRFRRFPPSLVMNKTAGPDDGRYDAGTDLAFTALCTALVRGDALRAAGLLDPSFLYYFEDTDLVLRIREAGYRIRLVPGARSLHKVERVTRAGSASPAFWTNSGRSARIFSRRHGRRHPWMAGPAMLGYLALRAFAEGGRAGGRHFLAGLREGGAASLAAVPAGDGSETDPVTVIRQPVPEPAKGASA